MAVVRACRKEGGIGRRVAVVRACWEGACRKGAYRKEGSISGRVGIGGRVGISGRVGIGASSSKDVALFIVYSGGVGK